LDDFMAQIAYIAAENPAAARRVADQIRETCEALGEMTTGRPGRVQGTYEKVVVGRPYIVAYTVADQGGREAVSILRVIHTARDWPEETWPG
jgi:plasmid stabilization system protein ParE